MNGNTTRVLNITITIGNLYSLELKDSYNIGINRALSKQGPFYRRGGRPYPLSHELED
jgi:hypothetical protein